MFLTTLCLYFSVCINTISTKWYVTQRDPGSDVPYCGNVSSPCRTIRFTVNKASSGDTIYIDDVNSQPYEECPKSKSKNSFPIQLNKSLSFICPNGIAEIQCHYSENRVIFEIPENSRGMQTISFISIKFTSSSRVLVNSHNDTRIVIKRCLFQKNNIAIYIKNKGKCDLLLDNSKFIDNWYAGVHGKDCADMMVHILNTTFLSSPVNLSNGIQRSWKWDQHFKVNVTNSSFFGDTLSMHHNEMQGSLFQANCQKASVLTISVSYTTFGNFIGNMKYHEHVSNSGPIFIKDLRRQPNVMTTIYFNQVIVKNIITAQRSTVLLILSPTMSAGSKLTILNCCFANNTRALKITGERSNIVNNKNHSQVKIENTIFTRNYDPGTGWGAAVTLSGGNYHILGCKFENNYSQNRYITGVVVLEDNARVTFEQCRFENTECKYPKNGRALQILSPETTNVVFKAKNVFNLRKLQRNQPIIIHTSPYTQSTSFKFGKVFLYGEIELKCPEGYKFVNFTENPITKTNKEFQHLEFNCNQCRYKTYSLERGGVHNKTFQTIECHDCPRGYCCPPGYCCQSDDE